MEAKSPIWSSSGPWGDRLNYPVDRQLYRQTEDRQKGQKKEKTTKKMNEGTRKEEERLFINVIWGNL